MFDWIQTGIREANWECRHVGPNRGVSCFGSDREKRWGAVLVAAGKVCWIRKVNSLSLHPVICSPSQGLMPIAAHHFQQVPAEFSGKALVTPV